MQMQSNETQTRAKQRNMSIWNKLGRRITLFFVFKNFIMFLTICDGGKEPEKVVTFFVFRCRVFCFSLGDAKGAKSSFSAIGISRDNFY